MTRTKILIVAPVMVCLLMVAAVLGISRAQTLKIASNGGVGCDTNSKAPEVFELYGDPATVLSKLENLDLGLDKRRAYAFAVESAKGAEIRFFEKQADGKAVQVSSWKGDSLGTLPSDISNALLRNKGVHCAGEQTKALLNSKLKLKPQSSVPFPASTRAAFAHPVQDMGSAFVRATVFLLC